MELNHQKKMKSEELRKHEKEMNNFLLVLQYHWNTSGANDRRCLIGVWVKKVFILCLEVVKFSLFTFCRQ